MKSILSILSFGIGLMLFSNTGCNKEAVNQDLCSEEVNFSKNSWIKEKLEFFNLGYLDYALNDNLITDAFKISYNNELFYVLEFHDESLYFYHCDGIEIDQYLPENLDLIHQLNNAQSQKIWPLNTNASGNGAGGGGGHSW